MWLYLLYQRVVPVFQGAARVVASERARNRPVTGRLAGCACVENGPRCQLPYWGHLDFAGVPWTMNEQNRKSPSNRCVHLVYSTSTRSHLMQNIVACQVHPALVKWSRVTRFYVNVSPLVHLSVSSRNNPPFERTKGFKDHVLSAPRDGFYWRPRLPGMWQYY